MTKIVRNLSTPAAREFWASAERTAKEVETWSAWKRAGINVSSVRLVDRAPSDDSPADWQSGEGAKP
jgi:hypothetical protein